MGRRSKNRLKKRKNRKLTHSLGLKSKSFSPSSPTQNLPPKPPRPSQAPDPKLPTSSTRLNAFLLSLLIFTLPTNLALHFAQNQAHVMGILIDYLIPKLYLSDLVIGLIFLTWAYHSLTNPTMPKPSLPLNPTHTLKSILQTLHKTLKHPLIPSLAALVTTLIFSTLLSAKPIASAWYLAKLLQLSLLTLWLIPRLRHPQILTKPLVITSAFQSTIAILQWIQKKSLLGYLFLGESTLKTSTNIAKTSFTGELRPLPYGTTPHPNVLAGFLSLSLILLYLIKLNRNKSNPSPLQGVTLKGRIQHLFSKLLAALYLLLVTSSLILTQSASAIFALILGFILAIPKLHRSLKLLLIATLVSFSLFLLANLDPTHPSLTRRLQLTHISLDLFASHPLLGTGPNAFTALMPLHGNIPGNTRFIQPVHNIYLLWLTETGLLGATTLLYFLWKIRQSLFSVRSSNFALPLLMTLVIGLVDHYPITLQTGQLLFCLSLALSLSSTRSISRVRP